MMNDIVRNVSYIEELGNLIHLIESIENDLNELQEDVNFLKSKTIGKLTIKLNLEGGGVKGASETLRKFGRQLGKIGTSAVQFERSMRQLSRAMAATSTLPMFRDAIKIAQEREEQEVRRRILDGR